MASSSYGVLPQLDRLHLAFKRSQVSPSASSSSQDQQSQHLRSPSSLPSAVSRSTSPSIGRPSRPCVSATQARFEEQRQLHLPQKYKATVPDSALRVEMNNLEEQADNAKARELFWKPLSWLGAIRPTSANDAFDPALWETFVCARR